MVCLPLISASEEVDVSVNILSVIPLIGDPTITNTEGSVVSTLDVSREYRVNFDIIERNGIDDLVSVSVSLFYAGDGTLAPAAPNERSSYEIVWDNVGMGTWSSYPSGHLGSNTYFKKLSPCRFEFGFPFILDKIAVPSGNENAWKARIEVLDSFGHTSSYDDLLFDVNDYVEWSGIPTQIDLTPLDNEPESEWVLGSPIMIQTIVTSNTDIDVFFQANEMNMDGTTFDPNEYFTICAASVPTGGSIALGYDIDKNVPLTMTKIYQGAYSTQCSLNPSVDGYVDHESGLVSFRIDVQDSKSVPYILGGNYTSSWYFSINRAQGITR